MVGIMSVRGKCCGGYNNVIPVKMSLSPDLNNSVILFSAFSYFQIHIWLFMRYYVAGDEMIRWRNRLTQVDPLVSSAVAL